MVTGFRSFALIYIAFDGFPFCRQSEFDVIQLRLARLQTRRGLPGTAVLRWLVHQRQGRADCGPSRPHWVVRSNAVLHSARGLRPFVNTPPSTKPCVLRSDPNRVLGGRAAKVDSAAHLAPGEIESEPAEADLALDHRNGPPPQPSISTRAAGQPIRESGRSLRAPAQADSAAAPGTGRAFVDELNPSCLKGGHHLR